MNYQSSYSKWQAFKYKDPFAADKFYICNKKTRICCRPNCDMNHSNTTTEGDSDNEADDAINNNDIVFINSLDIAINRGYTLCYHCLPNLDSKSDYIENESFVLLNLSLLLQTMQYVNHSIGFVQPLLSSSKDFYINEIMKISNPKLKKKLLKSDYLSNNNNNDSKDNDIKGSKGDLEHLKRIDMACRHIALAAQSTFFGVQFVYDEGANNIQQRKMSWASIQSTSSPSSYDDDYDDDALENITWFSGSIRRGSFLMQHRKLKTKKRRGGVLGFRELAAKSQISPWHFHRTFKNMTGITPKQYGDKCFQFLYSHKDECYDTISSPDSIVFNAKLANPSLTSNKTNASPTSEKFESPLLASKALFAESPAGSETANDSFAATLEDDDEDDEPEQQSQQLQQQQQQQQQQPQQQQPQFEFPQGFQFSYQITQPPQQQHSSSMSLNPSPLETDFNFGSIVDNDYKLFKSSYEDQPSSINDYISQASYDSLDSLLDIPDDNETLNSQYFDDAAFTKLDTTTITTTTNTTTTNNGHDNNGYRYQGTETEFFAFDQQFLLKQLQLQNSLEKRYSDRGFSFIEEESNLDSLLYTDLCNIISE